MAKEKDLVKNKGAIRLTVRDIFYTQAMEGLTHFERTDEYFKLQRDSRVCTLGFVYRFGKSFKSNKRFSGGASDEMQRVGNGN